VPSGQPVSMFDLNGNCRLSGRIAAGGPREGDRSSQRKLMARGRGRILSIPASVRGFSKPPMIFRGP
jgi:hypothetical protein